MRGAGLAVVVWVVGCGSSAAVPDASMSCWQYQCPGDGGNGPCGTCKHHFADRECPPGFVCDCVLNCVKGPRGPDGGVCPPDAGVIDGGPADSPDAHIFDWPACDP